MEGVFISISSWGGAHRPGSTLRGIGEGKNFTRQDTRSLADAKETFGRSEMAEREIYFGLHSFIHWGEIVDE
jgi:hypothetical protein